MSSDSGQTCTSGCSCALPMKYLGLLLVPVAIVSVYLALRPEPPAKPDSMNLQRLQSQGEGVASKLDQYAEQPAAPAKGAPKAPAADPSTGPAKKAPESPAAPGSSTPPAESPK